MKYATLMLLAIAIVLAGTSIGQQSAAQTSQRRDISGFNSIDVQGGIDVEITQGNDFSVEVEAPDGGPDGLHTQLNGTVLEIHRGAGSSRFFGLFSNDYEVHVTLPRLESLSARGGTEIDGMNTITGERLSISARNGSEIDLTVDVGEIEIELSGGSDIDLSGSADTASIHISGGSDFSGPGFTGGDVRIESSGGADTTLTVGNSITGNASGGSDVVYMGNPEFTDVKSSGGADVVHR